MKTKTFDSLCRNLLIFFISCAVLVALLILSGMLDQANACGPIPAAGQSMSQSQVQGQHQSQQSTAAASASASQVVDAGSSSASSVGPVTVSPQIGITASNNPTQTVVMEDKREFIQPPAPLNTSAEFGDAEASTIYLSGDLFDMFDHVYYSQAKHMAGDAYKDAKVTPTLLHEYKYRTHDVHLRQTGKWMGYIHIALKSPIPYPKLQALAMQQAMWYGATGVTLGAIGTMGFNEGGKFGIGTSVGASGFTHGGDVGMSGSAGAGYSKAKAWNRKAKEIMVSLWHDESMVRTMSGELRYVVEHYNHDVQRGK
jgi:hypothetical protein